MINIELTMINGQVEIGIEYLKIEKILKSRHFFKGFFSVIILEKVCSKISSVGLEHPDTSGGSQVLLASRSAGESYIAYSNIKLA